jgi:ABC-type Fe3+-hydroxamate transport system substrate-binding protein
LRSWLPVKRFMALALTVTLAFCPAAVHAEQPAGRIVSLVPSLTEDLFALGVGSRLVAVSEYTDYPKAAKSLPRVASFTSVDSERIVALHPDLVVGILSQAAMTAALTRANLHVVLFRDDTLDDIYTTIDRLGRLVGRTHEANVLVRSLRNETMRLQQTVDRSRRPSVFVVLDIAPIYTVGRRSYINTLITMAGGRNAANLGRAYGRYSAETLLMRQPDVIIADPLVNLAAVIDREPWRSLRAVRRGEVAYIPDPGILLHPGPRYNEGLRWLISVIRHAS